MDKQTNTGNPVVNLDLLRSAGTEAGVLLSTIQSTNEHRGRAQGADTGRAIDNKQLQEIVNTGTEHRERTLLRE